MTQEDRNVALLKDAYRAWSDGKGENIACWLDIVAEDATLRSLANGAEPIPFTAKRDGPADIERFLKELTGSWTMVSYDMKEFVAQGDRVVAIGRCAWRHKETGKVAETPKVDIWRFRDGKAVDFFELYDTALIYSCATPG